MMSLIPLMTTMKTTHQAAMKVVVRMILNSCEPFLTEYPTRDKVLAIFPLDGNVLGSDGNQFEFASDYKATKQFVV